MLMEDNDLELKIQIMDIPEEERDYLFRLTNDLEENLNRLEVEIKPIEGEKVEGTRGTLLELGNLLVIPLAPIVVNKLFNALQDWRNRNNVDITVEVMKSSTGELKGEKIIVTQKGVSSKNTPSVIDKLKGLVRS